MSDDARDSEDAGVKEESDVKGVQSTYPLPLYKQLVEDAKKNDRSIHRHQKFIVTQYLNQLAGAGTAGQ